jgi:hypothetical protein
MKFGFAESSTLSKEISSPRTSWWALTRHSHPTIQLPRWPTSSQLAAHLETTAHQANLLPDKNVGAPPVGVLDRQPTKVGTRGR